MLRNVKNFQMAATIRSMNNAPYLIPAGGFMKTAFLTAIVFLSSISSFAETASATKALVIFESAPSGALVICNDTEFGVTPLRKILDSATYKCKYKEATLEPVEFDLVVNNEEKIKVKTILSMGKKTGTGESVSIFRTPKKIDKKKTAPVIIPKDYSKEAEDYVLSKNGDEAQRLIEALVKLKLSDSDGGVFVTEAELQSLKVVNKE